MFPATLRTGFEQVLYPSKPTRQASHNSNEASATTTNPPYDTNTGLPPPSDLRK